jgi:hypothetical protein
MHRHALTAALLSSTLMFMGAGSVSAADEDHISFKMAVSKGASTCLPNAGAKVQIIRMAKPKTCSLWQLVCPPIPLSTSS